MKKCLVLGAGGFIGFHLCNRLRDGGNFVVGIDLKYPDFEEHRCNIFHISDLREEENVRYHMYKHNYDEVYQLAADMGGAGFVFVGSNDLDIMMNNAQINMNVARHAEHCKKLFFSSSACVYGPDVTHFIEENAYPASPDSEYGWEKLWSEHIYMAHGDLTDIKIARFHNIYGPYGTYEGGREKSPAAMCRKVSEVEDGGEVEVWGSGRQIRSFLYIDDCIDAVLKLMDSGCHGPVNVGSEHIISINDLAHMVAKIAGKKITIKNVPGPIGVDCRTSNNRMIEAEVGWKQECSLAYGMNKTYKWIEDMVQYGTGRIDDNQK